MRTRGTRVIAIRGTAVAYRCVLICPAAGAGHNRVWMRALACIAWVVMLRIAHVADSGAWSHPQNRIFTRCTNSLAMKTPARVWPNCVTRQSNSRACDREISRNISACDAIGKSRVNWYTRFCVSKYNFKYYMRPITSKSDVSDTMSISFCKYWLINY